MPRDMTSGPYRVVWLVRRLFRAMAHKAGEELDQSGISAADRAVMEFLYPDETLSVPEIAERYMVSRQHVQNTVNSLLDKALVSSRENPRHKRSPLIALNAKGKRLFGRVLERDKQIVDELFAEIPDQNIRITQRTLQILLDKLS